MGGCVDGTLALTCRMPTTSRLGPMGGRRITMTASLRAKLLPSFWLKVEKTLGCWLWGGAKDRSGYGRVSLYSDQGPYPAHRVSYALAHHGCPANYVVMHTCDNPACVRPGHLRLATQADNNRDKVSKGRGNYVRATHCHECGAPRDADLLLVLCRDCFNRRRRIARTASRAATQKIRLSKLTASFQEAQMLCGERSATLFGRNYGLWHFSIPERCSVLADEYGISRERVRQIVVAAARKLGTPESTFWGRI